MQPKSSAKKRGKTGFVEMCQCCYKAPVKMSRLHRARGTPQAFYLCVDCCLLDEKEFWRAFMKHFINRQLERKANNEEMG